MKFSWTVTRHLYVQQEVSDIFVTHGHHTHSRASEFRQYVSLRYEECRVRVTVSYSNPHDMTNPTVPDFEVQLDGNSAPVCIQVMYEHGEMVVHAMFSPNVG